MVNDVLVVTPTLGQRPDWLRASLASVRNQGVRADIRVVAPSHVDLSALCSDFDAELVTDDEPGLSRALNVGMFSEPRRHTFVTWLGDDDLMAPGSLEVTTRALAGKPDASMVYGDCRYIGPSGETIMLFRPGRHAWRYSRYGRNLVPQPGSLLRMDACLAVGRVDESYAKAMDGDLFLKLWEYSPPVYVAAEVAAFRLHPTSITVNKGSNQDEGFRARASSAARRHDRLYPPTAVITRRLVDRVAWGLVRRRPGRPVPRAGTRPYTRLPSDVNEGGSSPS